MIASAWRWRSFRAYPGRALSIHQQTPPDAICPRMPGHLLLAPHRAVERSSGSWKVTNQPIPGTSDRGGTLAMQEPLHHR